MKRENLTRYAWLSILAASLTIALKLAAYYLTNSIGLLSDALESLINLAAGIIALLMLRAAAAPPDEEHAFGHDKAEYFASGIEGTLILIAAFGIGWTSVNRLFAPHPLEAVGMGLAVSAVASFINLFVGFVLIRAGREHRSITLESDGRHLMTDVWTSVGVIIGVFLVSVTGWLILDPVIAILVAVNITWTGIQLMRRSANGLMDAAVAPKEKKTITEVLEKYVKNEGIEYHALRTRESGVRRFISLHIVVPGEWTVTRGHQLCEQIENDIRAAIKNAVVFTHLESLDDPASWADLELDRLEEAH
ncbi:MAG TPA: cation diffusion facilitator family transporter, partial [Pyrinomonadaceae bacterium]|nr:cation diffusion facilitator family transporter [Pyrinomonadaceae bacterium]